MDVEKVFRCTCHSPHHHFFVEYDKDDHYVYVSFLLNKEAPMWKRFYYCVKYLFGIGERCPDYGYVILDSESVNECILVLTEANNK